MSRKTHEKGGDMLSGIRNVMAFSLGFATSLLIASGLLYVLNGYAFSPASVSFTFQFYLFILATVLFLLAAFLVPEGHERLTLRKSTVNSFNLGVLAIYVIMVIVLCLPSVRQHSAWFESQDILASHFKWQFVLPMIFHCAIVSSEMILGWCYHPEDIARQNEGVG